MLCWFSSHFLPARFANFINFTQKPKISFFARSGGLVEPIYVNFGTAEEHVDPLARAKFNANRCIEVGINTRPRKFPLFGPIWKILGVLCAQLSYISVLHLTRFASQVTELLLRNRVSVIYPEFFRAPSRKICVWSKNDWHLFNGFDVLYHHAKFGEIQLGCRCENMVFMFVFGRALFLLKNRFLALVVPNLKRSG